MWCFFGMHDWKPLFMLVHPDAPGYAVFVYQCRRCGDVKRSVV